MEGEPEETREERERREERETREREEKGETTNGYSLGGWVEFGRSVVAVHEEAV